MWMTGALPLPPAGALLHAVHRALKVPRCCEDLDNRLFSVFQDQTTILVPIGTPKPNYEGISHARL